MVDFGKILLLMWVCPGNFHGIMRTSFFKRQLFSFFSCFFFFFVYVNNFVQISWVPIERNRSWSSQKTRPKSERDDKEGKRDNREKEEIDRQKKERKITVYVICIFVLQIFRFDLSCSHVRIKMSMFCITLDYIGTSV